MTDFENQLRAQLQDTVSESIGNPDLAAIIGTAANVEDDQVSVADLNTPDPQGGGMPRSYAFLVAAAVLVVVGGLVLALGPGRGSDGTKNGETAVAGLPASDSSADQFDDSESPWRPPSVLEEQLTGVTWRLAALEDFDREGGVGTSTVTFEELERTATESATMLGIVVDDVCFFSQARGRWSGAILNIESGGFALPLIGCDLEQSLTDILAWNRSVLVQVDDDGKLRLSEIDDDGTVARSALLTPSEDTAAGAPVSAPANGGELADATDLFDHRATIEGLGLEVVELGDRVEDGVAAIIGGEPHILVGLSTGEPAFVSLRSFEAPIELCGSTPEPPGCDGIEPLLESAEGHRGHVVVNERAEPIGVLGISFQGVVPTRAFEATGAVECYEEALRATRVDSERRAFIADGRGSCLSQMFELIF